MTTKLPRRLYVRMERDGKETYPIAFAVDADAIDGDGPTEIGVYQLVEVARGEKKASLSFRRMKEK